MIRLLFADKLVSESTALKCKLLLEKYMQMVSGAQILVKLGVLVLISTSSPSNRKVQIHVLVLAGKSVCFLFFWKETIH